MAWFKVDDGFYSSRKVLSIPRTRRFEALGLWTTCGAWTMKELTDGLVPREIVDELGGTQSQVNDLLSAKLWIEVEDGYRFHDWHDYQPTAKDIKQNRDDVKKKRSIAGAKGAEKRWSENGKKNSKTILPSSKTQKIDDLPSFSESEESTMETQNMAKWQSDGKADGKRIAPTQPNPLTKDKSFVQNDGKKSIAIQIPKDWAPNESHSVFAKENQLDLVAESGSFVNHAEATGRKMKNWDAAFSLWLRNAVKWKPQPKRSTTASDDWMNA